MIRWLGCLWPRPPPQPPLPSLFLLGLLLCVSLPHSTMATYRQSFLSDSCVCRDQKKLTCDPFILLPSGASAGHVGLSQKPEFYREFYCQFTIKAPPNQKVQLVVNDLDIPETEACKASILRIHDGIPGEDASWPITGLCGKDPQETLFRSSSTSLTLYYSQSTDVFWETKSFNITYTFFHIHRPELDPCNSTTEFKCNNLLCISSSLKCDTVNNCYDNSDENMEYLHCDKIDTKSDPVVGVAVGGVVGILLVISLICVILYRVKRGKGLSFSRSSNHQNIADTENEGAAVQNDLLQNDAAFVPDLTRDLPETRTRLSVPDVSDISSVDLYAVPQGEQPPSYSELFPDA